MNKALVILVLSFVFISISCNTKKEEVASLMDLDESKDSLISEVPSILDSYKDREQGIYYGIDISHYQGDVLKLMASNDSLHFVFAKATEGTSYIDPDFKNNWREIKERGLIRGAYHFYRFEDDPIQQAQHFFNQIKDIEDSDIAPVVDVEVGSLKSNTLTNISQLNTDLLRFLYELEIQTGQKPIIYTNTAFANKYLKNSELAEYRLWLAEYTNHQPRIPDLWKQGGYFIWQKSQNYNDVSAITDFDLFNGRLDELVR